MEYIGTYSDIIVSAITMMISIGTVGALVYRRVIRPMTKKLDVLVELIDAQMTPNKGSTIIDRVGRIPVIEATIDKNHAEGLERFKSIEINMSDFSNRLAAIDAAVIQKDGV